MITNQANARIVKLYRDIMRCYAIRWQIVRRDYREHDRACGLLSDAVRLRDLANHWEANPV